MNEENVKLLAALVAYRARVDTTEPDPKNLRSGWRTDQLLTDIDAYVIGLEGEPAAYAQIAAQARGQIKVSELPEIAALLRLAEFRGERLLSVSQEREASLTQMEGKLADTISVLPEGPRQKRCCSLFEYHRGVFYDAYGHFAEAADAQKRAADQADRFGDWPGAAICRFVEAVYRLKQALVKGVAADLESLFSFLEERFDQLVSATRGTAFEVQWGQGNGPCHMFQVSYIWLGKDHPDLDKWAASVVSVAVSLKGVWADIAKHYLAMNWFRKGDGSAKVELEKVVTESGDVTRKAEALLVLARRAIADGDKKLAKELVRKMPKKGASHIRAIAQRLLISAAK